MPIVSRNPATAGDGGGVQVVTVPVSSAQILDLANTPVVLIPGVAGNVTVVNGSAVAYVAGAVPYLDGGGSMMVVTGPIQVGLPSGAGFWDQVASQTYGQGYGIAWQGASADAAGLDTVLSLIGGANPTLGDGTLLVTLSYFLAPVA